MLALLAVYSSPEILNAGEDIVKILGFFATIVALYAAFEVRQRKVVRFIIREEIAPTVVQIEEDINGCKNELGSYEHRLARIEGQFESFERFFNRE